MSNYLWYLQCVLHLDQVAANLAADVAALDHADFLRHGEGQHVVRDFPLYLTSSLNLNPLIFERVEIDALGKAVFQHSLETKRICIKKQSDKSAPSIQILIPAQDIQRLCFS